MTFTLHGKKKSAEVGKLLDLKYLCVLNLYVAISYLHPSLDFFFPHQKYFVLGYSRLTMVW